MDIGYGDCIPYYYDNSTSIQLCICSTDRCGDTYSSCQASVNQAMPSPPPLLPAPQPTLSNTITCLNNYVDYSLQIEVNQVVHPSCHYLISFGSLDRSKCSLHAPNKTVICAGIYNTKHRDYHSMGMIEGAYESLMFFAIIVGALSSNRTSGYYHYQTSTSIASIIWSSDTEDGQVRCLCTTDNCNVNLATCTSGMNIPWSLLTYSNGSTSTTSTSGMTSSTSVSSSIITALQTSTSTSVAVSVGTVGNSNTPPATTGSGSLSKKIFSSSPQVTF